MQAGLVEAIVRGDRATWIGVGALWIATSGFVLRQRLDPAARYLRVIALLLVTTATSVIGMDLAAALAIPRIRWRSAPDPSLVVADGETWRRLGGPAVEVMVGAAHDVALPTIDAEGRWVLFGMMSGAPLTEYAPAPPRAPEPGGVRLCAVDTEEPCRAWPTTWPNPDRPPREHRIFQSNDDEAESRSAAGALAYDVESDEFLRGRAIDSQGEIEILGRITNDPPHEGNAALFMMRRLAGGHYDAMRVVSTPNVEGDAFRLQRTRAWLTLPRAIFRFVARPLLIATGSALPLAALAYLFAPALFAAHLKRRGARRETATGLRLIPAGLPDARGNVLASVADDAVLGDVSIARGTMVHLGASDGRPMASTSWLDLGPRRGAKGASDVGLLVPADAAPFRRAARAWVYGIAHPLAIFVAGMAAMIPAIVGLAALIAAR